MSRYYTRVCNFYYGNNSKKLVKKRKSLPLNGNKYISFDKVEIFSGKLRKIISLKEVNNLSNNLKKKVKKDIKLITKQKTFKYFKLKSSPILMGVLNITPDSFSDGGKYFKKYFCKKTFISSF